jgi:hypothetical protein
MTDFVAELTDNSNERVAVEHFLGTNLISVMFRLARMMAEDTELRDARDVIVRRVGHD